MWVRIPPGALAIVLALLAACSSGTDASPPTTSRTDAERADAEAWSARARIAYEPLKITAVELPTRVREWTTGERTDDELRADLDIATNEVTTVKANVDDLPAFGRDARVAPLYRASAAIYVEYVAALRAAQAQPPGALRDQVGLIARRLRVLGDRVFDRGQARLAPFLHETPDPNVEVHLPPEVPDWVADGMAAGPPLDDQPPPPAAEPGLREETRPRQPRAAWVAAVEGADVPAPAGLTSALAAADQARLRDLARRFDAVARSLGSVPDPAGRHGREDAAQLRLALLLYSEVARATQAGLTDIAKALLTIADGTWQVPGVPTRS